MPARTQFRREHRPPFCHYLTHTYKERFTVLQGTETPWSAERFRIFAAFLEAAEKSAKPMGWALESRP